MILNLLHWTFTFFLGPHLLPVCTLNTSCFQAQCKQFSSSSCTKSYITFCSHLDKGEKSCFRASGSRVNHPWQQWRYHSASGGHRCFAFGRVHRAAVINQTWFPREGHPRILGGPTHTKLQKYIDVFRTVKIFIEERVCMLWSFYSPGLAWSESMIKWLLSPAKGSTTRCYKRAQF